MNNTTIAFNITQQEQLEKFTSYVNNINSKNDLYKTLLSVLDSKEDIYNTYIYKYELTDESKRFKQKDIKEFECSYYQDNAFFEKCNLLQEYHFTINKRFDELQRIEDEKIKQLEQEKIELKEKQKQKAFEELNFLLTEEQEVLKTFSFGEKNRKFNVISLPYWKYEILTEKGMTDLKDILAINVINNLECGDPNGFCLSPGGGNIGPFQINFIHKELFSTSMKYYDENDYKGLYKAQLDWTINNLNNSKKICGYIKNEDKFFRCLLENHNRNNTIIEGGITQKEYYGLKGLAIKNELMKSN